ncbi:unnamed protein product [Coffea canephora]|uniref:Uncharacterized protein n=1 Tax=Coffea canephora TaxID=49390 RepID=A0A068USF5_COFCA|nr:unnamed protein product [Coffea canephora]
MDNNNSLGTGLMAVFAVSGSVALLAMQLHKRLLSDFMEKMELEIGSKKNQRLKKVRFADDAVPRRAASSQNAEPKKNDLRGVGCPKRAREEKLETLPLNWQALYKGIIKDREFKGLK